MKKSLFTIFTILVFLIKINAQSPTWVTSGTCTGADPSLQSVLINSCNVEVYTEFFIFNTGTSSFDPTSIMVQGSAGTPGSPPIVTGYTGSHPDMATMLAKLNSWTGCGGVFVAAPALIPPNSQVMAFNTGFNGATGLGSITPAPDLSSYCGKTIYVIAASYPGGTGIFHNIQSVGNALIVKFGGCITSVNYGPPFPQVDGAYLTCGSNGSANYNTTAGCFMPACTTPTATASISTGPCLSAGQDISLNLTTNAGAGATIMWSGPNSFSSSNQNPVHTSPGLPAGTYTYNVKVAQPGGCFKMTSVNVTVGPPLNFTALPDLTVCGTTAIPLSVTGTPPPAAGSTYQWSGAGLSSNTSATPTATAPLPTTPTTSLTTTYKVTVTEPSGCIWTDDFKITTLPAPPTFNVTTPISICSGQPVVLSVTSASLNWNGAITVPSGPNPKLPYNVQFSWSGNSFSNNTITDILAHNVTITSPQAPTTPGSYVYTLNTTISNSNSHPTCVTTPVNVTVNVQPAGTITYTTVDLCNDQSLNLNTLISAPSPVPTGTWAGTGVTASNFNPSSLAAGAYNVTFTPSAAACLSSGSTTVNVKALPVVTTSQSGSLCGTSAPYSGTVTLNATSGFTTYQWSSGVTGSGNSVTVNNTGTYTLTVTDINGCTTVKTYNVVASPNPTVAITAPASLCTGSNSTLTLNNTFSNYLWSDNSTINSLSITGPGTYSVTVSNADGCTATDSKTVAAATPLNPTIAPFGKICGTGSVTLSLSNTFSTYTWSNSGVTQSINVTSGGVYEVTVTDIATGCIGTVSVTVQQFAAPTVAIVGNLTTCVGTNSVLTTNPAAFSNYQWSNSTANPDITVSTPGTYSVTVTDANGCTVAQSVAFANFALPTPTIVGNNSVCVGQTTNLNVTGGVFSNYIWSNLLITNPINVGNGTFTVTVTDANNCTATASKTIIEDIVNVNIIGNLNVCPGKTTILGVNGIFNSYAWSNGDNTPTSSVSNGSYSVTVTNPNGCTAVNNTTVNQASQPSVSIVGNIDYCQGSQNPLSTSPTFSNYLWSNNQQTPSINPTGTATYSVTVTDSNGCTAIDNKNITENPSPTPNISGSTTICLGSSTTLDAGIGFNSYLWSTGAATQTITTNQTGLISVSVTDSKGCIGVSSKNITSSGSLNFTITGQPSFCAGENTTLNAGSGFTSYLWDTGEVTQTITVNTAKVYTVTVSNGACNGVANVNVVQNANPTFTITGKTSYCDGNTGILSTSTPFASYIWDNGGLNQTLSISKSGSYSVSVVDNNGCKASQSVTVTFNPNPKPTIDGATSICIGDSVKLSAVGGTFSTYLWSNGKTQKDIFAKAITSYSVTVTDANQCQGVASTNISQLPDLKPFINGKTMFCQGDTLHLTANSGFGKYTWSSGQNTENIIINKGATYIVTVNNGACKGVDSIKVKMNLLPIIKLTKDTAICEGNEATLAANAGTAIYKWSNGEMTPFINTKKSGTYVITVTTSEGCFSIDSVALTVNPLPQPNILGQSTICFGEKTLLSLSEKYDKYLWSNSATTDTISISQSGIYKITVTNQFSCTASTSKQIDVKANLVPIIQGNLKFCDGDSTTLTLDADYTTYTWSNNANNKTITIKNAGNYAVTVTSASGCSGVANVNVQKNTNPTPIISGGIYICGAKPLSLDAGGGYSSYNWSNGDKTQTTQASAAGLFSVTVSNSDGCKGSTNTTLKIANVIGAYSDTLCKDGFKLINGNRYDFSKPSGTEILAKAAIGGCDSILNVQLYFRPEIAVNITGAKTICSSEPVELALNVNGYSSIFNLIYEDDLGNKSPLNGVKNGDKFSVTPTKTTTYTIISTTIQNGNCSTTLGNVKITINPLSFESKVSTITCAGEKNGSIIINPTSGTSPFSYIWSNNASGSGNTNLGAGKYSVTISDASGCKALDSFDLKAPLPIKAKVKTIAASCKGDNGAIIIEKIEGGSGSFSYSLDNQNFMTVGSLPYRISNIKIGEYTILISETNTKNCNWSEKVKVLQPDSLKIDLGTDITLLYGDSVVLTPKSPFQMTKIRWTPKASLSCDTCQFVIAKPKTTTTYRVSVWDENGCIATDDIQLIINKIRRVFIPTAFSPNVDGTNDLFRIFLGDETVKVNYFRVYDRWGTLVYEDLNFTRAESQDQKRGWDGFYKGQQLNSGVFIYHAQVEFTDGEVKNYIGDVMLMQD